MKTKVQDRKTLPGTRTKLGVELEESGKEILAHLRGEVKLSTRRIVLPGDVARMSDNGHIIIEIESEAS